MKGVYVLIIQLESDVDVSIGALGTRHFTKGRYAYIGSAQANFEKRIARHLRREKRKFWHIDYLLDNPAAKIVKVLFKEADKTEECRIAREICQQNESVLGFGCSDCKCSSHMFHIKNKQLLLDMLVEFRFKPFVEV